ncbi:hypothetical protein BHE74_00053894, partial [Ensete ventricosum]
DWVASRQGVECGFQGRVNKLVDGCYSFWQVLEGGFKDKPGKQRDFYHSCYCLSGLSVSQYSCSKDASVPPPARAVLGPYANLLEPVHPLYNVVLNKYYKSHEFFSRL